MPFVRLSWNGTDAANSGFRSGNSPRDNRAALSDAYRLAQSRGEPLLIPAGEYEVDLDPTVVSSFGVIAGDPVLRLTVPLIGAGSSVTTLNFKYPTIGDAQIGGITESTAFATDSSGGPKEVSIEGLRLVGPGRLRAENDDGGNAPGSWAVTVEGGTRLSMRDVQTTGWNEAIKLAGTIRGATAHLERCYIKSRGTRIRHEAPSTGSVGEGLTLINCTIEQDVDGYTSTDDLVYCGILQEGSANLVIIGGSSLGSPDGDNPYDIRSFNKIRSFNANDAAASTKQIAISNHYFGPKSRTGIRISPIASVVQLDNCSFAGQTGIVLGGSSSTYHVSNCAFVGGKAHREFKGKYTYAGSAVRDDASPQATEVEAFFSNCRFGAALNDPVEDTPENGYQTTVVRFQGVASKPWRFSNCYFGGLHEGSDGRLFKAFDGVNLFYHCHLADTRAGNEVYPLQQHAGRIELHNCLKDGKQALYFVTDRDKSLDIVLESNVLRQNSMLVAPIATVSIRGSENEFGQSADIDADSKYDPDQITSNLQVKRGQSQERSLKWRPMVWYAPNSTVRNGDSPERVYERVSGSRSGVDGPSGTDQLIDDGGVKWRYLRDDADFEYHSGTLTLSWNADFVVFDRLSTSAIQNVNMRSVNDSNRLVGATIQLYAAQQFRLGNSGNINLPSTRTYAQGSVATLRYAAQANGWVVV